MKKVLKNIITLFRPTNKSNSELYKETFYTYSNGKLVKQKMNKEELFLYNLEQNKMIEPDEDYTNKNVKDYKDLIINENINHWDLKKICALNGIRLEINEGWHTLMINYLNEINKIGWNKRLGVVKAKWAELRVGLIFDDKFKDSENLEYLDKKFVAASRYTCETCGKFGKIRTGGWDFVACREHYHLGQTSIDCDDQFLTTANEKHLWDDLQNVTTEFDYYKQPSFMTLNFKNYNQDYLSTSIYGFGKLVSKIPDRYRKLFHPIIFEKYLNSEYCKVCGINSFYNHRCESCGFSGYYHLSDNNEFKYTYETIKENQMKWFKDGAELFYSNFKVYELNPNYCKLFNQEELNNYVIDSFDEIDIEDLDIEKIYKECNRKPMHNKELR